MADRMSGPDNGDRRTSRLAQGHTHPVFKGVVLRRFAQTAGNHPHSSRTATRHAHRKRHRSRYAYHQQLSRIASTTPVWRSSVWQCVAHGRFALRGGARACL